VVYIVFPFPLAGEPQFCPLSLSSPFRSCLSQLQLLILSDSAPDSSVK
jgi:hypothetical protein